MKATSRRVVMFPIEKSASAGFDTEQDAEATEYVISRLFDA